MIKSGIVKKSILRKVQLETIKEIAEAVGTSFGPMGSNSVIGKEMKSTEPGAPSIPIVKYSKDGHTILKSLPFNGMIEDSTKTSLEDITEEITKTVGDGTTSAVYLSYLIFKKLYEIESVSKVPPVSIIKNFQKAVKEIQDEILSHKKEFTADDAYNVSLISTNGNEEVATNIKNIYEEYGSSVYIDYAASPTKESMLKIFDGMSLETGYSDSAYMNDLTKKNCTIEKPSIYYFKDPIDTPEMIGLLDSIIKHNILAPYSNMQLNQRLPQDQQLEVEIIPTVILARKISKDAGSVLNSLIQFMHQFDNNMEYKPPFLLVTDIHQAGEVDDIARMCACKEIKKYLNPDQQKIDTDNGTAATIENVWDFGGTADLVESNISGTKFVNPVKMFKEDGTYSDEYQASISFLECELEKAKEEGEDLNVTGELKRRLNSLKANMVQYFVGGMSPAVRDALKDLVEDAVLNCRSAANFGVGYGSNIEGFLASKKILSDTTDNDSLYVYKKIILEAYTDLLKILYSSIMTSDESEAIINDICREHGPFNLVTEEFDTKVLSSIQSDVIILDCISKIITLMITSSQFVLPTAFHNIYGAYEE